MPSRIGRAAGIEPGDGVQQLVLTLARREAPHVETVDRSLHGPRGEVLRVDAMPRHDPPGHCALQPERLRRGGVHASHEGRGELQAEVDTLVRVPEEHRDAPRQRDGGGRQHEARDHVRPDCVGAPTAEQDARQARGHRHTPRAAILAERAHDGVAGQVDRRTDLLGHDREPLDVARELDAPRVEEAEHGIFWVEDLGQDDEVHDGAVCPGAPCFSRTGSVTEA